MKAKKTILKNIENQLKLNNDDANHFFNCAKEYIKAIKHGRMICNIEHVSRSGMTRYLNFKYLQKNNYNKEYNLLNTHFLFKSLGYSFNKNHYAFRISGCGMDMVFNTNYNNIHDLFRLGFISENECKVLAQKTPPCV